MILRLRSGSTMSSRAPRKRSAALTCTRSTLNCSRNVVSTCSASPARSSPVSTKTHVSWSPTALCTNAAATAESTPPDRPQITRSRADLGLDGRHRRFDDRRHRPGRPAPAHVVEEGLEDLLPAVGVGHLGVELHTVDSPGRVLQGGDRHVSGRRGGPEAGRGDGDPVEMAHPHVELGRHRAEQHRRRGPARRERQGGAPVLAAPAVVDDAAELAGDQLGAVADAEHRHPGLVDGGIEERGAGDVDGLGAAGQDHARRPEGGHLVGPDGVRDDLAVHVRLPDPPGDQLGVLGPEVDDEDRALGFG